MKKVGERKFIFNVERQRGFTLMEVMIVTAIIGILSAIAIPNILRYRETARLRGAANEMLSTFRKAQGTAVKRKYNTGLVFNAAAGTATVFFDNGEGGGTANDTIRNGGEREISTFTLPRGCNMPAGEIDYTDGLPGGNPGFTPRGLPALNRIGSVAIHSTSTSSNVAYQIVLSMAGRTRINIIPD